MKWINRALLFTSIALSVIWVTCALAFTIQLRTTSTKINCFADGFHVYWEQLPLERIVGLQVRLLPVEHQRLFGRPSFHHYDCVSEAIDEINDVTILSQYNFGAQMTAFIPHWLTNLIAWSLFVILWRTRRKYSKGHCQRCGYDLTGNESGRCPECNTIVADQHEATV